MKASLNNYRQAPRKTRLVANLVKGKRVDQAILELSFLPKRASGPIAKLIASAVASAKHNDKVDAATLIVKKITVDKGVTMKRMRPRSRGMANRINKRTSNVTVELAEKK